jgi:excisionase family DNA binding protein
MKKKSPSEKCVVLLPPADVDLLKICEVAAILRLSVSCIRAWVLHRRIPYIKIQNKAIRFRRADLDAWIVASLVPAKTNSDGCNRVAA